MALSVGAAGVYLQAFGAVSSIIGSYYQADLAKTQAKSQALNYEYQQQVAEINARSAEINAQQSLRAGEHRIAALTMEYGQKIGSAKASMAARGIVLGQGSAQEVVATTDVMKELDMLTVNSNAAREAAASRMQAASFRSEGLMAGASATAARGQADAISPWASTASSLIGEAGSVAQSWYNYKH